MSGVSVCSGGRGAVPVNEMTDRQEAVTNIRWFSFRSVPKSGMRYLKKTSSRFVELDLG